MNTIIDQFERDGNRVLDRLVDGQLSDAERRALLAYLENEPAGWRRCALAFLEEQTWRGDLGALRAETQRGASQEWASLTPAGPMTLPQATSAPAQAISTAPRRWLYGLALAASVLVAFGGGVLVAERGWRSDQKDWAFQPPLASTDPKAPLAPQAGDAATPVDGRGEWSLVELGLPYGNSGQRQLVEVPVRYSDSFDPQSLRVQQSGLPPAWFESMQRRGHQVERKVDLLSLELGDGRQVVVPVEQVDVRFEGYKTY